MSQMICIILLWVILATFVIVGAERIDGPVIMMQIGRASCRERVYVLV